MHASLIKLQLKAAVLKPGSCGRSRPALVEMGLVVFSTRRMGLWFGSDTWIDLVLM